MRKIILALSGAAIAITPAVPTIAKEKSYVCTKWKDVVCVSTHRVKGEPPARAVGYVFGPSYSYTPVADIPEPVVTYYHLEPNNRYVYSDGYIYVIDPSTYAITRVIDPFSR